MQGLMTVGMAARDGGFENTAALDAFSLVLFWGGVMLLAAGYYVLRTGSESQQQERILTRE